jgi:hypothetical protein
MEDSFVAKLKAIKEVKPESNIFAEKSLFLSFLSTLLNKLLHHYFVDTKVILLFIYYS